MIVNGKKSDFDAGITVNELLQKLNLSKDKVVVEVNLEIIAKEQYVARALNTGDKVEIVSFVGGG